MGDRDVFRHVLDVLIEQREYNGAFRTVVTVTLDSEEAHKALTSAMVGV